MKELDGIIYQAFVLDVETVRAQRLQELKDLAEWRSRRLGAIKEWSDPVKREARLAEIQAEQEKASAELDRLLEKDHQFLNPLYGKAFSESVRLREVHRKSPDRLSGFKKWLGGLF